MTEHNARGQRSYGAARGERQTERQTGGVANSLLFLGATPSGDTPLSDA